MRLDQLIWNETTKSTRALLDIHYDNTKRLRNILLCFEKACLDKEHCLMVLTEAEISILKQIST